MESRPTPGEPLESTKVVVEVIDPLAAVVVVVVVATVVVAVVIGVVVAAAVVVFLPTPPKLRRSSIENFNAVGKSNPPSAKICPGLRVAAVVVVVVDAAKDASEAAVAGVEITEHAGGVELAVVAA